MLENIVFEEGGPHPPDHLETMQRIVKVECRLDRTFYHYQHCLPEELNNTNNPELFITHG